MGAFNTETLRQGIEGDKAANLLSLYADDAELRIVDRNTQPSNPRVLHGRGEIGELWRTSTTVTSRRTSWRGASSRATRSRTPSPASTRTGSGSSPSP